MLPTYHALIVGAGPAGCAAAFDLARAGRRVLLLDKRTFPRSKACACGLTRKTLKALRYAVDPVIERRCRDVVLQEAGAAFLTGRRTADKGCEVRVHLRTPFCAMAVRTRFDAFCLEQTLAAGTPENHPGLQRIDSILELREFPGHVELDVALPDGTTRTLAATVLIGADGSNGQTRRLAAGLVSQPVPSHDTPATATAAQLPPEPAWYARGFALEATVPYFALPAHLPAGDGPLDLVFDFAPIAGGYGWLFPKGDHINIGVGGFVPREQTQSDVPSAPDDSAAPSDGMVYETVSRALLNDYTRTKLGVDLLTLPHAHVTGQHLGLGGNAYTPQGRILLTGDAAGLVDPLTGEGIYSAIVSGQAAAAAVLDTTATDPAQVPGQGKAVAAAYLRHLALLQSTLNFSHRAARSFYREPERGFKVMRTPFLRGLVLKTYADGLPTTNLLASLARRVA